MSILASLPITTNDGGTFRHRTKYGLRARARSDVELRCKQGSTGNQSLLIVPGDGVLSGRARFFFAVLNHEGLALADGASAASDVRVKCPRTNIHLSMISEKRHEGALFKA